MVKCDDSLHGTDGTAEKANDSVAEEVSGVMAKALCRETVHKPLFEE